MKNRRIVAGLVALITLAALLTGMASPASADTPPPHWNSSWSHRLGITVMTADALASGYSVDVTFDHAALVGGGQSLDSGNDVRVVRWDGSSWAELDRVLAVGSSWNATDSKVYFRTQTAIPASSTDTSYYLYYGNGSAGAPPANAHNVYDLFDDFSGGALDTGKWVAQPNSGVTVAQTGGQLVVSGTTDATSATAPSGIRTAATFGPGFAYESSFSIVTQCALSHAQWKASFGLGDGLLAVDSTTIDKRVKYFSNGWVDVADSSLDAQTFGFQRLTQTQAANGALQHFENGTLMASRSATPGSSSRLFTFSPDRQAETFEVRKDDIIIRKYVTNEPVTTLEQSSDTSVSVVVPPSLTFTVVGHYLDTCNGATKTAGSSASGNAVGLGRINSANGIAAQRWYISTNAASGWTVYFRSTGTMTSPNGHSLANVPGTNPSPASFPSLGTEAFGYTVDQPPFNTDGGNKWATLTTMDAAAWTFGGPHPNAGVCIAYQACAGPTTPAGDYSTTVVYTVIGTF